MTRSIRLKRFDAHHFMMAVRNTVIAAADTLKGESFRETEKGRSYKARQAMKTYGNSVLRLAYSYMHNMQDSEDILQETMIRYIQSAPVFESSRHEKAWLLRVCANLSKNKIQYNKYRDTDELNETLVAEKKDDLSFVWDAVKGLPENYRAAVHLYYYEGYSTKEVAGILSKNESTIRSDLKRARDKLKTILKEEYDFE